MKLLIAESADFSERARTILQDSFDVQMEDLDRRGLKNTVRDVDVLWVRLRNRIDAEILSRAPRLRAIVTNTTGLNHIDLIETSRRSIRIISLSGEEEFLRDIRATAEMTVGLALAVMRKIPAAFEDVIGGRWDRYRFVGNELFEKTAGIVGYGRLGRIVARYFKTMGMHVVASDPRVSEDELDTDVQMLGLNDLLERADVVSLHVNYAPENVHMFGAAEFSRMKIGSFFVNTSRGELVDEDALLFALRDGTLAGAAVDVLQGEHPGPPASNLITYARGNNNLLITPHIGGNTTESMEKTEYFLARRLLETQLGS